MSRGVKGENEEDEEERNQDNKKGNTVDDLRWQG